MKITLILTVIEIGQDVEHEIHVDLDKQKIKIQVQQGWFWVLLETPGEPATEYSCSKIEMK